MASNMAMASALNGKQKRHLRALAHHKKPVVQLGKDGLTDAVCTQIDQSLEIHELIKVKVGASDQELDDIGQQIAQKTRSNLCDVIGRTLLFYRRRSKEPTIVLPRARAAKGSASAKGSTTGSKA
jgi:RNA-binding protein